MMNKTLDEKLNALNSSRRMKIEQRAEQLIAEELTLQQLRKAHHKTQVQIAKRLHMTQAEISRLEQRSDLLLSTLRKFVQGMGGRLSLVSEIPDKNPLKLAGLAEIEPLSPPKRARKPALA
jgi:hypothetical protein